MGDPNEGIWVYICVKALLQYSIILHQNFLDKEVYS